MKYDVVISDYDGTLLRSDKTISEITLLAIKEYQKRGGKFMVCTGRMPASIIPHLKEIGLSGDVICSQGAVLCDIESGEIKRCCGIPYEEASGLIEILEQRDLHLVLFANGISFVSRHDEYTTSYDSVAGVRSLEVDMPLSRYVRENKLAMNKVLCVNDPDKTSQDAALYTTLFTDGKYSVCISEPYLLEFVGSEFTKGAAISDMRETYFEEGVKIIALGDSEIDLSMIEAADLGVAMANAEEKIRNRADFVTKSNDEDGVGYVIRRFCLEEEE